MGRTSTRTDEMRARTDLNQSAVSQFFTEWEQAASETTGRSPDHRARLETAGRCLPRGREGTRR